MIDDWILTGQSRQSDSAVNATVMSHNKKPHWLRYLGGPPRPSKISKCIKVATYPLLAPFTLVTSKNKIRTILRHNNLRRDYELPNQRTRNY
ncbi:uncharacterized protein EAE98_003646 [Botrytis deweyae]|uniref:Uncharacterized protein n=1 Tax=Botrytis deweyae TaxID=2478750 RepID=A0ABQ7IU43_9HELO|nr:uncharacterized protein EAE98_003646 [Botrytis deweyae]KAF7933937.1 hypothetical protein EAE98_003646 [Botrytis deweyae]